MPALISEVGLSGFNTYAMAVVGKAADLFDVSAQEIMSPGRHRHKAWPRMAAAWALREADPFRHQKHKSQGKIFTLHRLCEIFGWDDHTTAIHAIGKTNALRDEPGGRDFRRKTDELLSFAVAHRPVEMLKGRARVANG